MSPLSSLLKNEVVVREKSQDITIAPYGQNNLSFSIETNLEKGKYTIEVSLIDTPFGTIRSVRNFAI